MRILVDGEVFQHAQTGVAKVTRGLYGALLRRDPSLQVAFICRGDVQGANLPGASSVLVPACMPSRLWRRAVVPGVCLLRRPDVVHYPWNGRVGPFLSSMVVTTIHDVLPLTIPSYFGDEIDETRYRKVMTRDIGRSDVIITDSQFSLNEIKRHFHPAVEPVVVSPATDIAGLPDCWDGRLPERYFLYVGGYARRKGIEKLLRAFHAGHGAKRLHHQLILTGEPGFVTAECARLIREGREAGFVEERGYVDESQLAALYRHATALVYPSCYEGFGLPPLEALTLGCPVLTTPQTSLREVCGEAAVYVDPEDTDSFLEALCALEEDALFRNELIGRGLKQASRFSWDKSAEIFLSLLMTRGS